ncbi:YgiQ family radical SAM protein [Clostridium aminobutyricum]|uniref:YgiQ family radical SAM protein n=1 Tax=Clostridium aminobutyricum TaxID=33953 RepID=A0A939IGZ8_CLOAM|nr:YgiQ family radical SAM protein [Clostridium aminobutyricum]MBN7772857.1 YgiQ family radical SAM protein [Clostridium aminobutyricum]
MSFLPITKQECEQRGWPQPDFVLITGDGYIDHPSFGTAIISRILESRGFKVAILAQPDWNSKDDFMRFGKPRLGFLINAGNVDSMVNHYSVFKHKRRTDAYTPGGAIGKRPNRAVIVYSNRAREAYKDVPIVIGGIEASLRRLGHYDYWDDKVRKSILLDSKADILIYGMGERSIVEIAEALDSGIEAKDIGWIRGTCVKAKEIELDEESMLLPSFEEIVSDKKKYCESFAIQYGNNDFITGKRLIEPYGGDVYVVQNPPQEPLSTQELDDVYELSYEGTYHPVYEKDGGIPAIKEVEYSIVSSRGCFGGCSFCALTYHQGRQVRGRSKDSIVREGKKLIAQPGFKGYIHDVGGPTANFRGPACKKQLTKGVCSEKDCLYPSPCSQISVDHKEYLELLRSLRGLPGVKKVFIRSGIRFDYVMADQNDEFLRELCKYHVSGILKVAPEHVSERVLSYMRKPEKKIFEEFSKKYKRINEQLGLKQYLIPYLISSHPGSTLEDAIELALFLKENGFIPDQVQDFYPTPGTLSTCMYYTEMDPLTMKKVFVPKTMEEKKMQRALIHFNKPENRETVKAALIKARRPDLIGVLLGRTFKNQEGGPEKDSRPQKSQNQPIHRNTGKNKRSK